MSGIVVRQKPGNLLLHVDRMGFGQRRDISVASYDHQHRDDLDAK
jgi:hypothetical protein